MDDITPRLTIGDVIDYLLAYLLWLVIAAVSMVAMLFIRNALNAVWPVISDNRWLLRPIDRFGLVFMGLVWLVFVIFVEQYYRLAITDARYRRLRLRTRAKASDTALPRNPVIKFLRRLGLDILVRRFVPTLVVPLILLGLAYGAQTLAFFLMTR